jgi:hypothetical protein
LRPASSASIEGDISSTMITGSAMTGIVGSIGLQVTPTSGIAEISSVRTCGPSISAVHPNSAMAWRQAKPALLLMMACFIEANGIRRGWPGMNSSAPAAGRARPRTPPPTVASPRDALLPP